MTIGEKLDFYANTYGFSFKELSAASGVSVGTISHYRSGKQTPKLGSQKLEQLADGIAVLAARQGTVLAYADILAELSECVSGGIRVSYQNYIANVSQLLRALGISNADLARHLNYDTSQLSRFLSGERVPADLGQFTAQIASYIANQAAGTQSAAVVRQMLGVSEAESDTQKKLYKQIIVWLGSNVTDTPENPIGGFLDQLDAFDLNDYINKVRFNDIKVPTVPFDLPSLKYYRGIEEFKQSEFDFMRTAALSRSREDLIIYSDMPISEMGKDTDFAKKYVFGFAVLLRKGLHIHFIHDVHRPFDEMLLGLAGYIPMYMTGQISPYYFSEAQSRVFSHLLKVSGTAAMYGMAVSGDHADGLYVVTTKKSEVRAYRQAAETMLSCAKPLMDIYRSDRKAQFLSALRVLWQTGSRRMVFTSLPLFTASEELLTGILTRCGTEAADLSEILAFRAEYLAAMTALLQDCRISIEIAHLSEDMFRETKPLLGLSQLFYEKEIPYNYAEYTEHLRQTYAFAERFANCTVKAEAEPAYRNVSFSIIEGKCVIVSKSNSPATHFVIHHPKMIKAFERFVPTFRE